MVRNGGVRNGFLDAAALFLEGLAGIFGSLDEFSRLSKLIKSRGLDNKSFGYTESSSCKTNEVVSLSSEGSDSRFVRSVSDLFNERIKGKLPQRDDSLVNILVGERWK